MEELEMKLVPFMGAELAAAKDVKGQIWAGVNWMCRGIGLSKGQRDAQVEKIQTDEVLKRGCRRFPAGVFDPNNEVFALALEYVPMWLAKINVTPAMKRKNPEVSERLTAYQLKAKDVLAAAFLPKGDILDLGELSPIMQVLVRMEQRQKAQDYAIQDLTLRVAQMEARTGPTLSLPKPPADTRWLTRCQGILFRAAKKARTTPALLDEQACRRAAEQVGSTLSPRAYQISMVSDASLREAYIKAISELAEWYGV